MKQWNLKTRLEFSSKTLHLQSLSCKESLSTLLNDKVKSYTAFVLRNVLDTVLSWIEAAAKAITLYSKQRVRPRYIK